jgi:hypothetical protein
MREENTPRFDSDIMLAFTFEKVWYNAEAF